jgi:hypothetical protein
MVGIWVCRDKDGVVDAASVAEYTDPAWLKELRVAGRNPELVLADNVTLGRPLPSDVIVCR